MDEQLKAQSETLSASPVLLPLSNESITEVETAAPEKPPSIVPLSPAKCEIRSAEKRIEGIGPKIPAIFENRPRAGEVAAIYIQPYTRAPLSKLLKAPGGTIIWLMILDAIEGP